MRQLFYLKEIKSLFKIKINFFPDGSAALSAAEKQLLQKLDPKNSIPEKKSNPEKNPDALKLDQKLKIEKFANKAGYNKKNNNEKF